jgi:hypothetical protein
LVFQSYREVRKGAQSELHQFNFCMRTIDSDVRRLTRARLHGLSGTQRRAEAQDQIIKRNWFGDVSKGSSRKCLVLVVLVGDG